MSRLSHGWLLSAIERNGKRLTCEHLCQLCNFSLIASHFEMAADFGLASTSRRHGAGQGGVEGASGLLADIIRIGQQLSGWNA
jgi:hypothetical protein